MKLRGLLASGAPPLMAAIIGSIGSRQASQVYRRLQKPRWAPPSEAFGPVWSTLYVLIGVAGWRMWKQRIGESTWALHAAQLALNAAWPFTFFTVRDKRISLAVITALDALVATQIADLAHKDAAAAAALGPYLGWILFATVLNRSISDPAAVR